MIDMLACRSVAERTGIVFLRYNQWPERETATHEEAARLREEERRFGGACGDKSDDAVYRDEDSPFIIEDLGQSNSRGGAWLRTPAEWIGWGPPPAAGDAEDGPPDGCSGSGAADAGSTPGEEASDAQLSRAARSRPRVFVLDLNGHFCVAVPCQLPSVWEQRAQASGSWQMLADAQASRLEAAFHAPGYDMAPHHRSLLRRRSSGDRVRQLLLLNTTDSSYLSGAGGAIASLAFDCAFPPHSPWGSDDGDITGDITGPGEAVGLGGALTAAEAQAAAEAAAAVRVGRQRDEHNAAAARESEARERARETEQARCALDAALWRKLAGDV
jgi:hypothetical protein